MHGWASPFDLEVAARDFILGPAHGTRKQLRFDLIRKAGRR